ncbi:MAG: hypothetical protein ACI4BA_09105 [Prevotella sp.]
METLVMVMMVMACFCFVLKQTFHGIREIMVMSVIILFFIGMSWGFAIEQSKVQIAAWIADSKLMLDMAVLLSVDVALTMLFCVWHVDMNTSEYVSPHKRKAYIFLKYFPGMLVFPVLFSMLVLLIFMLPGMSFQVIAWGFGSVLFVLTPLLVYGLRRVLPEPSIRLELLFLFEVLLGLMGVIATVNGRTAVTGVSSFNANALLSVTGIVLVGMLVGYGYYYIKNKKLRI